MIALASYMTLHNLMVSHLKDLKEKLRRIHKKRKFRSNRLFIEFSSQILIARGKKR